MSYIYPVFILFFGFTWATILEMIAHFLIQNKIKPELTPFQSLLQFILATTCSIIFFMAWCTYLPTYPIYCLFISALWITVYTDTYYMLISRLTSLYLAPIGIAASIAGTLPIKSTESIVAAFLAGSFLIITNAIFKKIKGHDGLGQGDIELIICIGAWLGFLGTWCTILIASITGTFAGTFYLLITQKPIKILPFGPFLALGALTFLQYSQTLTSWLLPTL